MRVVQNLLILIRGFVAVLYFVCCTGDALAQAEAVVNVGPVNAPGYILAKVKMPVNQDRISQVEGGIKYSSPPKIQLTRLRTISNGEVTFYEYQCDPNKLIEVMNEMNRINNSKAPAAFVEIRQEKAYKLILE